MEERIMLSPQLPEYYRYWLAHTPDAKQRELVRLFRQNTSTGLARWGVGYGEYLDMIVNQFESAERTFNPVHIAEIGVGIDARLVIQELQRFGNTIESLDIYEIDKDRLEGAKATLEAEFRERPDILAKISYIHGPAQETLHNFIDTPEGTKQKQYGLINAQLLFQHLEETDEHPTRQRLQEAIAEALSPFGIYIIDELAVGKGHWDVEVQREEIPPFWKRKERSIALKHQRRSEREAKELNDIIQAVRERGWPEGKPDFESGADIARMVKRYSRGELVGLPHWDREWSVRDMQPGSDEAWLMQEMLSQQIPPTSPARRMAEDMNNAINRNDGFLRIGFPTMTRHTFIRQLPGLIQ